jgi:hypothetical protein
MPRAKLEILAHSGHLYPTEEPHVDEMIAAFMADSDAAR